MSSDNPPYDLKARRVKQLLSSYYGVDPQTEGDALSQQSAGATEEMSSSTSVGTPKYSSIDSPAFNVDTYVSTLVRTARVDTLLKKHGEMVKEIRSLDSDMQMLVYENYNKFISATDTIRSMKSNVDGMGAKMDALKKLMGSVAETSNGVNSKLQKHRNGIEELSRVKALLEKIQCVIDLPKRMTIALKQEAFTVAVNNYCEARPLLKKYGHQGAFRSVASDCEAIVEEICRKLEQKLQDPKEDAEECVLLLQKIESRLEKLQDLFLTGRRSQIEKDIAKSSLIISSLATSLIGKERTLDTDREGIGAQGGGVTISDFVSRLNSATLNRLCETASSFNATFSAAEQNSDHLLDRKSLIEMSKKILQMYRECLSQAIGIAAIHGAVDALAAQRQETIEAKEYTDRNSMEMQSLDISSDFGVTVIFQCLSKITADLSVVECRLPEVEPSLLAIDLTKSSIEYHVSICFNALAQRVVSSLVTIRKRAARSQVSSGSILKEFGMTDLHRLYVYICELLLKGLTSILEDLSNYQSLGNLLESWDGLFIDVLQEQIHHLFVTLLKSIGCLVKSRHQDSASMGGIFKQVSEGLGSMPLPRNLNGKRVMDIAALSIERPVVEETGGRIERPRSKCPSGVVLLCARLCQFLEATLVPRAVEILATLFPGGGTHDQPAFNPSEIIRKANTSASELLRAYIELYSRSLALVIRQSTAAANWLHHKEPRAPRPVCDLIVTRLETAEKEIVQLVDDGGNRSSASNISLYATFYAYSRLERTVPSTPGHKRDPSSASVDASESTEGTVLERNVAKLFRERVQIGKKAEFTQSSIQAAILSGGLASLIESIRRETLGRAGLQQIQLDVVYLRPLVGGFVRGRESETVSALLEEVIAAAVERSVDPTPLETAVIDKILLTLNE